MLHFVHSLLKKIMDNNKGSAKKAWAFLGMQSFLWKGVTILWSGRVIILKIAWPFSWVY